MSEPTEPGVGGGRIRGACAMCALLLAVACTGHREPATGHDAHAAGVAQAASEEPSPAQQTPATIVFEDEAFSALELLDRADRALEREEYERAARDYSLVAEHARLDTSRQRALFGWATSLDWLGKPREALRLYSQYIDGAEPGPRRDNARVRRVRLLVYLEEYRLAGEEAEQLKLDSGTPLQQLALLAARAHALLSMDRLGEAERKIVRARAIIDDHRLDRMTVPPLDVASLFFALGELRRKRAEDVTFEPFPNDFAAALEQRCRYILDAQTAYSEAMRSQDAHWSSMAGVRVGGLYQDLHSDLMGIEPPASAETQEKRELFEGAMRLRYSILLEKSEAMMRATVQLLERNPQSSRWRAKAREALEQIEQARQREEDAIDALPYTRLQLQQVLDETRARTSNSSEAS